MSRPCSPLLLLDSFAPDDQPALWRRVDAHYPPIPSLYGFFFKLLLDLRAGSSTPLLVFVDCLVLLDILQRWGQVSFHPHPADVVHFDVIFPLLDQLRRRKGPVQLVKVKSHTGCLLNERPDEWAESEFHAEPPEICREPPEICQKYGSVWLGVRPHIRASTTQLRLGKSLPRDNAPNHQLLHTHLGRAFSQSYEVLT